MKSLRLAILCVVLALVGSARAGVQRLEPDKTWVVIAGVLEWTDPGLVPFPKEGRKDRELDQTFGALGVDASRRTMLLDEQATAAAIERALTSAIDAAPADATLVFYFAGHGVKDQDGHIIFASADTKLDALDKTGLHLTKVARLLERFRGKRVVLLADCCHSGGLVEVADQLAKRRPTVALTSAEASNISTANWTFTQTVIDALTGRALIDTDGDGAVELEELVVEVKDAMRYREGQRFGFGNRGVEADLTLARVSRGSGASGGSVAVRDGDPVKERARVKVREWVRAPRTDAGRHAGKEVARVVSVDAAGGQAEVEFYDYNQYVRRTASLDALERAEPRVWPVGTKLDVTWQQQVYQARVEAVDDGFMFITYPGYERRWDEWISERRVVGESGKKRAQRPAKVEWNGRWYDAVLREEKGGLFCISYVGYTSAWDECVDKKRIRF